VRLQFGAEMDARPQQVDSAMAPSVARWHYGPSKPRGPYTRTRFSSPGEQGGQRHHANSAMFTGMVTYHPGPVSRSDRGVPKTAGGTRRSQTRTVRRDVGPPQGEACCH
jgi:hypothetical protein